VPSRLIALALLTFAAPAFGQLVTPEKEAALRALLPTVTDAALAERLAGPLVLYDDLALPQAYQRREQQRNQRGQLVGQRQNAFRLVVRSDDDDPNTHFPWITGGGLSLSRVPAQRFEVQHGSLKFLALPSKPDGGTWPVIYFADKLDARIDQDEAIEHRFPVGTIRGEVLTQRAPDGMDDAFEMRLRVRQADGWSVERWVPYRSADVLAEAIAAIRPDLTGAINSLTAPLALRERVLSDGPTRLEPDSGDGLNDRDKFAVRFVEGQFALPPLPADVVRELFTAATWEPLTEPFKRGTNNVVAWVPTNNGPGWNLVPPNYAGSFLGNSRESCFQCHNTAGMNGSRFENTWAFRNVRGSDGDFSFRTHSVRDQQPIQSLAAAGVIEPYDPSKHPPDVYVRVPEFDNP
jgi:hypothetical protein